MDQGIFDRVILLIGDDDRSSFHAVDLYVENGVAVDSPRIMRRMSLGLTLTAPGIPERPANDCGNHAGNARVRRALSYFFRGWRDCAATIVS